MVHDPIGDETYVAEQGRGTSLNGEPIKVSNTDELIRALIATGFPYDRAEMPEALELFGRFAATTQGALGAWVLRRLICATWLREG